MPSEKIPGIYNYCDRWCERCAFTSKCAVFDDEQDSAPGANDIRSEAYWERLRLNFSKAKDIIEQAAARYGVDLKTIAQEADDHDEKLRVIRRESREHPIAVLSEEYGVHCMEWVQTQPGLVDKVESLKAQFSMGLEGFEEAKSKIDAINDGIQVIQWYETFIHVKLMRALMGRERDKRGGIVLDDNTRPYDNDSNGSAKIAMIGMDRSMQAWQQLYQILPEQEDEFIRKLGVLEKLKRLTEEEFPNAMAFKRPGLDD